MIHANIIQGELIMKKILSYVVILTVILMICNIVAFCEKADHSEPAVDDATMNMNENSEENLIDTIIPSDITISDLSKLLSGYLSSENKFSFKTDNHPEKTDYLVFDGMIKDGAMGFNTITSRDVSGIADLDNYVAAFTYCFDSFPGTDYFDSATVNRMERDYNAWRNTSPTYLNFVFDMLTYGQVMADIDGHPSDSADKIWPYVQILLDAREEPQTIGDWTYSVSCHSPEDNDQFKTWYVEIDASYTPA